MHALGSCQTGTRIVQAIGVAVVTTVAGCSQIHAAADQVAGVFGGQETSGRTGTGAAGQGKSGKETVGSGQGGNGPLADSTQPAQKPGVKSGQPSSGGDGVATLSVAPVTRRVLATSPLGDGRHTLSLSARSGVGHARSIGTPESVAPWTYRAPTGRELPNFMADEASRGAVLAKILLPSYQLNVGEQTVKFGLSPGLEFGAVVVPSGSRERVRARGIDGPVFDEVLADPGLMFSPDGSRVAYIGRRGESHFVVVNETEFGPYGSVQGPVFFSADSSRHAFVIDERTGADAGNPRLRIVLDGQPTAGAYQDIERLGFGPLDHQLVAVVSRPIDGSVRTAREILIGETTAPYAGHLCFAADGRVVFAEQAAGGERLVIGGVAGEEFSKIHRVYVSARGSGVAYAATRTSTDGQPGEDVVVCGSSVIRCGPRPLELQHTGAARPVLLSRDGTQMAMIDRTAHGMVVVTPGGSSAEYDEILAVGVPDAPAPLMFAARKSGRVFFVRGGEESAGIVANGGEVSVSAGGESMAITITSDKGRQRVYLNGVGQEEFKGVGPVVFSGDGRRVAYVANADEQSGGDAGIHVVVDGQRRYKLSGPEWSIGRAGSLLAFTADGNDVRYMTPIDANGRPSTQRRGEQRLGHFVGGELRDEAASVPRMDSTEEPATFTSNGDLCFQWQSRRVGRREFERSLRVNGRSMGVHNVVLPNATTGPLFDMCYGEITTENQFRLLCQDGADICVVEYSLDDIRRALALE